MGRTIFIDNLSSDVTASELTELLAQHGTVETIELVKNEAAEEDTQAAFVVMQNGRHGRAAIDGQTHSGRVLKVRAMKGKGASALGTSSSGMAAGPGQGRHGGRAGVFGAKGGTYGHKGRGTSGGRNA